MKVRVTMNIAGQQIDETLTGADAEDVLAQAKARVAKELGWKGLFLNAMTPLSFAQKAVGLYNSANHTTYALPQTAEEFLRLGQDLDYIQILPEN
jgi:hypothetical protein